MPNTAAQAGAPGGPAGPSSPPSNDKFNPFESLLILLGLIIFSACTYLYVTDYPVGKFIFGPDFVIELEPVGRLKKESGGTRRKVDTETEFKKIITNDTLYNFDTIVTGPETIASIELNDGSIIELSPKTMVRLVFEDRLGLSGITRSTTIDVLSGQVKGKARTENIILKTKEKQVSLKESPTVIASIPKIEIKPPEIKPLPAITAPRLEILQPANGSRLIVPKNSPTPKREVNLKWKVQPKATRLQVTLNKIQGRSSRRILSREVRSPEGLGSLRAFIKRPGLYEFSFEPIDDEPFENKVRTRFIVAQDFTAIRTLPSLFGGAIRESSRLRTEEVNRNFDIQLRWRNYPKARRYEVSFFRGPTSQRVVFQRAVNQTEITLNRDKVFDGEVYYQISSDLPSGFTVYSERTPFKFKFLPPVLVEPKDGLSLSKAQIRKKNDEIIFTWEKTDFTEMYQLELSRSKSFPKAKLIRRSTSDNFFIVRSLPPGRYYWRVKSLGRKIESPHSAIHTLTVTP